MVGLVQAGLVAQVVAGAAFALVVSSVVSVRRLIVLADYDVAAIDLAGSVVMEAVAPSLRLWGLVQAVGDL